MTHQFRLTDDRRQCLLILNARESIEFDLYFDNFLIATLYTSTTHCFKIIDQVFFFFLALLLMFNRIIFLRFFWRRRHLTACLPSPEARWPSYIYVPFFVSLIRFTLGTWFCDFFFFVKLIVTESQRRVLKVRP